MAWQYQNGMATPEELGKDAWIRGEEEGLSLPTPNKVTNNKALQGGELEKR